MDKTFCYCICISNRSVRNSEPVTKENSEFCYVFRVFDPPTHAPYHQRTTAGIGMASKVGDFFIVVLFAVALAAAGAIWSK